MASTAPDAVVRAIVARRDDSVRDGRRSIASREPSEARAHRLASVVLEDVAVRDHDAVEVPREEALATITADDNGPSPGLPARPLSPPEGTVRDLRKGGMQSGRRCCREGPC